MVKILLTVILLWCLLSSSPSQDNQLGVKAEIERLSASVVKLFGEKKFEEALKPAKRALDLSEKNFGNGNELVAVALNNLAKVYGATGKIDDAERLYTRSLAIYEKLLGPDSPEVADILDSLGHLEHFAKRNDDSAEAYYSRSLHIREKTLAEGHEDVLKSIGNLIEIYLSKGDNAKAEPLIKRIVEAREKTLGSTDPKLVLALGNYACFLRLTKRADKAVMLEDRAYAGLLKEAGSISLPSSAALCRVVALPLPEYANLIKDGITSSGSVSVELTIDESGKVIKAKALTGPTPLRSISVRAAANSRFIPLIVSSRAVAFSTVLTYSYNGLHTHDDTGVSIY